MLCVCVCVYVCVCVCVLCGAEHKKLQTTINLRLASFFSLSFTRAGMTSAGKKGTETDAASCPEWQSARSGILWWEDVLGIAHPRTSMQWLRRILIVILASWTLIGWLLYFCFNAAGKAMPHIPGWYEVSYSEPESIYSGMLISFLWPFSFFYLSWRSAKLSSFHVFSGTYKMRLWASYGRTLVILASLNLMLLFIAKFLIHSRYDAEQKYLQREPLGLVIFDTLWTIIAWMTGSLTYMHAHLQWVVLSLNGHTDAQNFSKAYDFVEETSAGTRRVTQCVHSFEVLSAKYESLGNNLKQISAQFQGWLATLFFVAVIILLSFLLELNSGDPNGTIGIRFLYLLAAVAPVIWSATASVWPTMALSRIQYTLPKLSPRADVRFVAISAPWRFS